MVYTVGKVSTVAFNVVYAVHMVHMVHRLNMAEGAFMPIYIYCHMVRTPWE